MVAWMNGRVNDDGGGDNKVYGMTNKDETQRSDKMKWFDEVVVTKGFLFSFFLYCEYFWDSSKKLFFALNGRSWTFQLVWFIFLTFLAFTCQEVQRNSERPPQQGTSKVLWLMMLGSNINDLFGLLFGVRWCLRLTITSWALNSVFCIVGQGKFLGSLKCCCWKLKPLGVKCGFTIQSD